MMLPLRWAGAQHSQSPVGADMSNGDGASMLFRFAESVVNIAHVPKECPPPKADIGQLRCRLRCRANLADKHLASKVHCVDDEIIGWLTRREQLRREPRDAALGQSYCSASFKLNSPPR
jgi:hypothetical protein